MNSGQIIYAPKTQNHTRSPGTKPYVYRIIRAWSMAPNFPIFYPHCQFRTNQRKQSMLSKSVMCDTPLIAHRQLPHVNNLQREHNWSSPHWYYKDSHSPDHIWVSVKPKWQSLTALQIISVGLFSAWQTLFPHHVLGCGEVGLSTALRFTLLCSWAFTLFVQPLVSSRLFSWVKFCPPIIVSLKF